MLTYGQIKTQQHAWRIFNFRDHKLWHAILNQNNTKVFSMIKIGVRPGNHSSHSSPVVQDRATLQHPELLRGCREIKNLFGEGLQQEKSNELIGKLFCNNRQKCCCNYFPPRPVVLNLFYIFYLFIKQDYRSYPQYTQWCSFIKNTKLTNFYSLEWFTKNYICSNLWFSKFTPLEGAMCKVWNIRINEERGKLFTHISASADVIREQRKNLEENFRRKKDRAHK